MFFCGHCHVREARVHVTQIVGQAMTKLHLCDICFRETHPEPPSLPMRQRKLARVRTELATTPDQLTQQMRALDCKNNPEHFERLLNLVIQWATKSARSTRQQLFEWVPETDIRRALRKVVQRQNPGHAIIAVYALASMRNFFLHRRSENKRGGLGGNTP